MLLGILTIIVYGILRRENHDANAFILGQCNDHQNWKLNAVARIFCTALRRM